MTNILVGSKAVEFHTGKIYDGSEPPQILSLSPVLCNSPLSRYISGEERIFFRKETNDGLSICLDSVKSMHGINYRNSIGYFEIPKEETSGRLSWSIGSSHNLGGNKLSVLSRGVLIASLINNQEWCEKNGVYVDELCSTFREHDYFKCKSDFLDYNSVAGLGSNSYISYLEDPRRNNLLVNWVCHLPMGGRRRIPSLDELPYRVN